MWEEFVVERIVSHQGEVVVEDGTGGSECGGEAKNLLDVMTAGRELPPGYDRWGIKSVRADLRTRGGFQWASPGCVTAAPGPICRDNGSSCPRMPGDGVCVATTWAGMATGAIPARTLLLVAWADADRLSTAGREKVRVRRAIVVDVVDGERLVREYGADADLGHARLDGADLRLAALRRATLRCADLRGVDLFGADMRAADLCGADLSRADLSRADLRGADLSGAVLRGADLRGADLSGAVLRGADLRWTWLRRYVATHASM